LTTPDVPGSVAVVTKADDVVRARTVAEQASRAAQAERERIDQLE
jgi:hypothetical protein